MAQYVPHYEDWRTVEKWRTASTIAFYAGFFSSVLEASKEVVTVLNGLSELIRLITFITLITYTFCELVIDYWLVPAAEDKRRADFLDNAFGTHFMPINSVEYYTNDSIKPGIYKAAVNLFENSLFTYRVSAKMTIKKTIWTLSIAFIVLILGFYGFRDQPLGIPVFQLLFSSVALIDLVKFWYMRQRMQKLYDGWYNLFHNYEGEKDSVQFTANVLRYWQLQETTLARTQVGLDSKLFNELNPSLSTEWEIIKQKLKIKFVA